MTYHRTTGLTVALACLLATLAAAPAGADGPALANAVDAPTRDCRAGDTLHVALGRSGVDLVPLYANDYQLTTPEYSLFEQQGLSVELVTGQDLPARVEAFLRCDSPILRATQGQLQQVAELTADTGDIAMVGLYHHGWSSGADHVVAREHIDTPIDFSGKQITIGAFSPRIDLLAHLITTGQAQTVRNGDGADWRHPRILFTEESHGLYGDTPAERFFEDESVDAALAEWDDAAVLTSGGGRGTGAEGSVAGAHIPLSTRSASRVLAHVYVIRRDYLEQQPEQVERFVAALFNAEEQLREDVATGTADWQAAARYILGDEDAAQEAEQMWSHVETVGLQGNVDWANPDHPRSFARINREIGEGLAALGLITRPHTLDVAELDYAALGDGIFDQRRVRLPDFDRDEAARAIDRSRSEGDLDARTMTRFTIHFDPNQTDFPASEYADDFTEVIDAATRYGGAVFTIEGHADPLKYLQRRHEGASKTELESIRRSARNLSLGRAREARSSLIEFAEDQGITLDDSQFVTEGRGLRDPATGLCADAPCPPQTEREWRSNMRVVVRAVRMEAESSAFSPPDEW